MNAQQMPQLPNEDAPNSENHAKRCSLNPEAKEPDFKSLDDDSVQADNIAYQRCNYTDLSKTSSSTKMNHFRPGFWISTLAIAGAVMIGTGSLFRAIIWPHSSYEEAATVAEYDDDYWFDTAWSETVEAQPVSVYVNENNRPVITFKLEKADPGVNMEFATGDLIYKGINVKDLAALPSMGPATNEAWISMEGEIHFSPEELEDIVLDDFVLADTKEDSIITPITDQIYIEEAEDDLDTDSLIRMYKAQNPYNFHNFEILSQESRNGKEEIRFRMSKQGNEDSYFNPYADLQILFKKGGEVVFADQFMPSEEVQDSDTSVDLTYTTPFDIPEYDEVVISDLS
ncbi:hypothetical protein [Ileibacterium valens]|uniref:hypothetical protein n=1 Tax=Ileibacterium valens TaxID=1862668 RepID=UPI0027298957|nr:hypothetical protein [Ileibacterium valens]